MPVSINWGRAQINANVIHAGIGSIVEISHNSEGPDEIIILTQPTTPEEGIVIIKYRYNMS